MVLVLTIVEATNDEGGILANETATFTYDEAYYLFFGNSFFNKDHDPDVRLASKCMEEKFMNLH